MTLHPNNDPFVTPEIFERQLIRVADGIEAHAQRSGMAVTKMGLLAASGMPGIDALTRKFGAASYAGLSTYSTKINGAKDYFAGDLVRLKQPANKEEKPLAGQLIALFDNGSNRGELLLKVAQEAQKLGATTITAAAMANKHGIRPNVVGALSNGPPSEPYWKFEQYTPGAIMLRDQTRGLDQDQKPNALIAVGRCFTAATEFAKASGIDGRYVGGLCVKDHQPDTSWVEIGDCTGLRVAIVGPNGICLQSVAEMVERENGTPQLYTLPS